MALNQHPINSSLTSWEYERMRKIAYRLDMNPAELIRAALLRVVFSENSKRLVREGLAAQSDARDRRLGKTLDVLDKIGEEVDPP